MENKIKFSINLQIHDVQDVEWSLTVRGDDVETTIDRIFKTCEAAGIPKETMHEMFTKAYEQLEQEQQQVTNN